MITAERLHEVAIYDPVTGIFRWKIRLTNRVKIGDIAGSVTSKGYFRIRVDGHLYLAHRLAWLYMTGEWPEHEVDHDNLTKADNRWENLRAATRPQNMANTTLRTDNTSGFKGVWWHKQNKRWIAEIRTKGGRYHLGCFDNAEAAHAAYAAAAQEHFGEFSRSA